MPLSRSDTFSVRNLYMLCTICNIGALHLSLNCVVARRKIEDPICCTRSTKGAITGSYDHRS